MFLFNSDGGISLWMRCFLVSLFCISLNYVNCRRFNHHFVFLSDRLPYSIRILLESAIRNCDEFQVTGKDVEKILDWENSATKQVEIPFKPARVLLQVLILIPAIVSTCFVPSCPVAVERIYVSWKDSSQ